MINDNYGPAIEQLEKQSTSCGQKPLNNLFMLLGLQDLLGNVTNSLLINNHTMVCIAKLRELDVRPAGTPRKFKNKIANKNKCPLSYSCRTANTYGQMLTAFAYRSYLYNA